MRCRPSMRMSLTVKAAGSAVGPAAAGAAIAEARARASRRRERCRVIVTSGWGFGPPWCGGGGSCGWRFRASVAGWLMEENVVEQRQSHQADQQRQAHVLPGSHRTLAQRAAFDQFDKVIQQVSPI